MREPGHDHLQERFAVGWLVLVAVGLGAMILTIAVARGALPKLQKRPSLPAASCTQIGCAKIGDHATYVVSGKVTSISVPQPGVVCVEVSGAKAAGQYCALSP